MRHIEFLFHEFTVNNEYQAQKETNETGIKMQWVKDRALRSLTSSKSSKATVVRWKISSSVWTAVSQTAPDKGFTTRENIFDDFFVLLRPSSCRRFEPSSWPTRALMRRHEAQLNCS